MDWKMPFTFGACSAFNFLTSSPCWTTRLYGQDVKSEEEVGGAGVEAGGAMPGLYSTPVCCLNCSCR